MLIKLAFLVPIVLSSLICAEKVRYDDYSLHKVYPETDEQVAFLKELQESSNEYDFWKAASKPNEYVSIVTPPHLKEELEHALTKRSIRSEIMLENIQAVFDSEAYSRRKRDTTFAGQLFWDGYQTAENINAWFYNMADAYPGVVSVHVVGQSYEARNITALKISRGSGRRAFVLEAGSVGADWLSPPVVTYIADQLIRGVDAEARQASEDFDWYIVPVSNPDGYAYSQDVDRLWTKNRRPITTTQTGVDLTKNWNSQWGVNGGSFTPADSNYIGLGPFSESETRSLSRFIEDIENLAGFLSFRQFGQRLVIPFAHTNEPLYNYNEMVTIGRRAMGALSARYETQYRVGNSIEIHDGATGNIVDWAKYRFNPPVAATYLLRDTGASGYIININQIQPSCQETFDSILAIIREARSLNVL